MAGGTGTKDIGDLRGGPSGAQDMNVGGARKYGKDAGLSPSSTHVRQ